MQHERDGQCGEHAEDRERTAHIVAEGRKEHEEELGDHEIAKPVGGGSEGAADAAHAEREDLTDEHPGDRTPGEREAKDIDGNQNHGRHGQSGYIAGEVEDGKRRKRNGHDHGAEDQQLLTREPVHDERGHDGGGEVHHTDADRHPDGVILGESKALDEHLRQEVDHGVDADKLLEEHDTDRDFFDFVEFELHLGLVNILTDQREHLEGVAFIALAHKVARGFRQQDAADEQQCGRDECGAEHPPPVADAGDVMAKEAQIGCIGQKNAEGDHKLEERGERSTALFRREFGQIGRGERGGGANGEAEDDACGNHHEEAGGGGAHAGTDEEQDGGEDQQLLTSETIGERADRQGSYAGANEHR